METKKQYCSCVSKFQDQKNGTGLRTHNKTIKGWRCTVCGTEKKVEIVKVEVKQK